MALYQRLHCSLRNISFSPDDLFPRRNWFCQPEIPNDTTRHSNAAERKIPWHFNMNKSEQRTIYIHPPDVTIKDVCILFFTDLMAVHNSPSSHKKVAMKSHRKRANRTYSAVTSASKTFLNSFLHFGMFSRLCTMHKATCLHQWLFYWREQKGINRYRYWLLNHENRILRRMDRKYTVCLPPGTQWRLYEP